ncbi:MAG: TnpV protein, partial [Clostridia bacterium]|nr:TnpV protein [Clostridia bacterium]
PIGKWGRMHLAYLKEHKPGLYSHLILSGKLYRQLAELNDQAQARLEAIIRQMQRSEGVDERMKEQDQMLWVGRMNSIRERAEEIILAELIFI